MNLRQHLAEARIALRQAKDTHDTAKVVATLDVTGKNDDERKRNTAQALLNDRAYTLALMHVRVCEATLERIEAELAEQEHQLRVREVAARERLAEALMGRRSDDAVVGEVVQHSSLIRQRIARGGYADDDYPMSATEAAYQHGQTEEDVHWQQHMGHQEPVFPAGSNAGEYYPNDWYKS